MNTSANIVIPFDFPFAILGKNSIVYYILSLMNYLFFFVEHRNNSDSNKKLVYAVADGQYTYGPLSLFQYRNDEKYSKM